MKSVREKRYEEETVDERVKLRWLLRFFIPLFTNQVDVLSLYIYTYLSLYVHM